MNILKKIIAVALVALTAMNVFSEELSAKDTIQAFYKRYLNYNYHVTPNIPRPELGFSQSFSEELKKNDEICKKYGDNICGWAADSDEYLSSQEQDDNLSYDNSGIKVVEISPGMIRVSLNVFPFDENNQDYERVITYKMIIENGQWVADDVIYGDKYSSREQMKEENELNILHPSK